MKNKLIILLLSFLLLGNFGCKKEKPIDVNPNTRSLDSATKSIVPEELPEWLKNEIKTYMGESTSFGYFRVYKSEWEENTIYFIRNSYQSCLFCDYRYENGERVILPHVTRPDTIYTGTAANDIITLNKLFPEFPEDWILIYEYTGSNYQDPK